MVSWGGIEAACRTKPCAHIEFQHSIFFYFSIFFFLMRKSARPQFYLPQVQWLIIRVLMRSRCSEDGGGGGFRSEVWSGESLHGGLSGEYQPPSLFQLSQNTLCSRVNIYSAKDISTEKCLAQWNHRYAEMCGSRCRQKGSGDFFVCLFSYWTLAEKNRLTFKYLYSYI